MKNGRPLILSLTMLLLLAGCSSQQGQQASTQNAKLDEQALASQLSASSTIPTMENVEPSADTMENEKDNNGGISQEGASQNNSNKAAPANKESAIDEEDEYKASFFGTDSSEILSCTVYHGNNQEEVDVKTARGKYLVQMLSGFMENPNYKFPGRTGIETEKSLKEQAKMHKAHYYVSLQFKQKVSCSYPQMGDQWTTYTCTESFDSAIINVGANTLSLSDNSGNQIFICQDPEMAASFSDRCEEWEQIEDWDTAFARLEAEQAKQKEEGAETLTPAPTADTGQDGQLSFLGVEGSQPQACTIYHGEKQQELDLSTHKGQEFIRRLSAFLLEKDYSDGPMGWLDGILLEDLGTAAQENDEDYYILLQFAQPWAFVLNGKPEGTVRFRDCDMLLIEVSKADKALRLIWHHPDMEGAVSFIGNIGVYEKKVYKSFLKMYEEWASLS